MPSRRAIIQSLSLAIAGIISPKLLSASTLHQRSFKGSMTNNVIKLIDLNLENDLAITFNVAAFISMQSTTTQGVNLVNFAGEEYRVTNSLQDIRNGLTR